ncbi:hypothetical protein KCU65_g1916, partial [Aureobasidium melanogenum]
MTDAWFGNAMETNDIDGEGCRRSESMTLKAYLRNEITLSSASHQITRPTENSTNPDDPLLYLWGLLNDAMLDLHTSQLNIVNLFSKIQTRDDVQLEREQRIGALGDTQ